MALVSTLHKAHEARKEINRPCFRFLRIRFKDRNQGPGVVLQFLVAIRTGIRIQEIAKFNTTVGTFEFIHDGYLVKVSGLSGLFSLVRQMRSRGLSLPKAGALIDKG